MKTYILFFLLLSSCATSDNEDTEASCLDTDHSQQKARNYHQDNVPELTWGGNKAVKRYQQYFISGLPTEKTLLYARAAGITTIVDLRPVSPVLDEERNSALNLQMEYINIAVPTTNGFDININEKLAAVLSSEDDKIYLIHHDGIDLAAAWFGLYLATRSSLNTETALSIASGVGLTNPAIRAQLAQFLDHPPELPIDEKKPMNNTP